jgi:hypothetical protein
MLDFIKALLANASERIKNPLIGTFITSWTIFNWKAILFLLFSAKNIETKFTVLSTDYSNIWNLLWFPLIVALAYIFGLPYINLGIDKLLSHSSSKYHDKIQKNKLGAIKDETTIEIAKIELEEAKAEFKGRESKNQKIEDFLLTIRDLQNQLSKNEEKYNNTVVGLNGVNAELTKTIENYNNQINKLVDANSKLQLNFTSDMELGNLTQVELERIFTDIKKIQNILYETKKYSKVIDAGELGSLQHITNAENLAITGNKVADEVIKRRKSLGL